jgi:hypothetical protein
LEWEWRRVEGSRFPPALERFPSVAKQFPPEKSRFNLDRELSQPTARHPPRNFHLPLVFTSTGVIF